MNTKIDSLHKILKDETRRKIIFLLQNKQKMSYTHLLEALGITSTGKLNYHLKVLGDLVSKTENGEYTLTEKGILASQLLLKFSGQTPNRTRRTHYSIVGGMLSVIVSCICIFAGILSVFLGTSISVSATGQNYFYVSPGASIIGIFSFIGFVFGLACGVLTIRRRNFPVAVIGMSLVLFSGVIIILASSIEPYSGGIGLLFGILIILLSILSLIFAVISREEFV